jgi:hypothetical protein
MQDFGTSAPRRPTRIFASEGLKKESRFPREEAAFEVRVAFRNPYFRRI